MYYIKADAFYYKDQVKPAGYLEINGDTFGKWRSDVASDAEVIDYTGSTIAPGLVDTHIHGFAGHDVMDNSQEGLKAMSEALLATGVTSFLPTALTASFETLRDICQTIAQVKGSERGAKIQGIFFEGPFFTTEHKGAQNPDYMKDPSLEEFAAWQEAAQGLLKKIAVAPEREGVDTFIETLSKEGIIIALGHSNATYEEAKRAVASGASVWVHAYNGMRGLNHREPGMVGAVLDLEDTYAELICDGHHVHPAACHILMTHKGYDHVALITDCMSAGGSPEGDYMLGEFPVIVKDGTARLKDGGSLAGSILELKDGVKHVIDWGIATPHQAIQMASHVAAKSAGIDHVCGSIKEGRAADFIVLDKDFNLQATYIDGSCAYQA
ncbi:N-acetylglucosamine-6-phosphate deacetylase [Streptococcus sp. zg-JUN1979]|uniref:N-acetylglucosamine-6-phosphate deacetylase n=1 Tax=Streptococcus sp. zg-JUN1979 TaxID=3391450 RepID=UPI0039A6B55E